MRHDTLYLRDIIEAAQAVGRFVAGYSRDRFVDDEILRSAVLHKLTIIGEAAARLSTALREQYPHIEWADIVGFRNIAVHEYFSVDWDIVWVTATQDTVILRQQIEPILRAQASD